jgi:hypothetical protein
MQLRQFKIGAFENLRAVEIVFSAAFQSSPGETAKPIRSHALIGQNGTGKSNLIEALITIFRDIDLNRDAAFDYTLEYAIRGHIVRIQADTTKQKRPFVWVDGDKVSQDYLLNNDLPDKPNRDERRGPRLLPTHLFPRASKGLAKGHYAYQKLQTGVIRVAALSNRTRTRLGVSA